ncbi:uncharacterized protein LOC113313072 [Papaver somniferum]|uniref:uncharacterized protein LOC113313072 n=1 Tax=Papaver somniferum TaxID=3469 RepID=UPI000E6FECD0|nr:uncharacterized protein LOC113313072 [Papaver somniferum]
MGQLCDALNEIEKGKLPSQPQQIQKNAFQASTSTCNESSRDHVNVVTTLRSGKVFDNNVGVPQSFEFKSDSPVHTTPQKTPVMEKESEHDSDSKNSTDINVPAPFNVHVEPFPQILVPHKKGMQYNELLGMFKRVNINIPFLEAINHIPAYAKFLKDLCTQKRKIHVHKRAFLTEQVSSIIQNKTPPKFKDPGSPTITCTIGDHTIDRDLPDLGASVNLLPYSVYEQLGLGELNPTHVTLQLADRSVKIPRGIFEYVLIKVEKFYFPVDFIVLDTQPVQYPDNHIPVILGRPFLATSNAIINCCNGVLNLSFGKMTVELNVFNISQQPSDCDDPELHEINMIGSLIQDSFPDILSVDPLQALEQFPLSDSESTPFLDEAPKLDLKPFPDSLKYAFLGSSETLPVIIASCLDKEHESKLLEVLKEHKEALGWNISDLKGISPTICMHHINLEENTKPSREMQRRLNPNMRYVVKGEILKLLDAGIIYPIPDS